MHRVALPLPSHCLRKGIRQKLTELWCFRHSFIFSIKRRWLLRTGGVGASALDLILLFTSFFCRACKPSIADASSLAGCACAAHTQTHTLTMVKTHWNSIRSSFTKVSVNVLCSDKISTWVDLSLVAPAACYNNSKLCKIFCVDLHVLMLQYEKQW